jgi:NAD(P)H-nitrite reductase large subunit
MTRYLIIGNSAGGIGAIEGIREVDTEGEITLVSEEPYPAYSRPSIAEYLMGERAFDDRMLFRDRDFYSRYGVETRLGVRVTHLDVQKREALLDNGQRLPWDRLLLATGGTPIVPSMEGLNLRGVHTFITIDDARRMDQALREGARRVVVIGGGLIGCSLTNALLRRGGVEVTVVELREHILTTMMDSHASQEVENRLRELGVRLLLGRTVARILPSDDGERVRGVVLDNGEEVPCDLVGVAVGVRPRVELAKGTPIQVNRGFVVNTRMETSVPGVYACGDAVEAFDPIYGTHRVIAIWPNAYMGGRTAGLNMAGVSREYNSFTAMNAFSYFDLALASGGMFDPEPGSPCQVLKVVEGGVYKKVVLRDGRVVGFIFMGDIQQAGVVYRLMIDRVPVGGFQDALLSRNFGLVSLPRGLREAWIWGDGKADLKAPETSKAKG